MRRLQIISILVAFDLLCSCTEQMHKITIPETKPFSGCTVFSVNEVLNPQKMAFCHGKLVIVNSTEAQKDLLYFYDPSDMSLSFSALNLGNGNQEVVDMNPSFFSQSADGFKLNTCNWMGISSFRMDGDSVEKTDETIYAPEPMNDLLLMDDGTFIYKDLNGKSPFTRIEGKGKEPAGFGEFPESHITTDNKADKFNFFDYHLTALDEDMMVFYQYVPRMEIYHGTVLVAKCEYESAAQEVASMEDFYRGKNTSVYFISPQRAGEHVYAVFVNKTMEQMEDDMSMQLLEIGKDGTVPASWRIDEPYMVFTVSPDEQYFYAYKETGETGEIRRFGLR